MEAFFLKLVNMSITASWLVLPILAVRCIFKNAPKWILCLLWGLVAFRLICPFSIESHLSLIPNTEPIGQSAVIQEEPAKPARGEILDSEGNVILEQPSPGANGEILDSEGNAILEKEDGAATFREESKTQTWISLLSKVWFAGVCCMLVYTMASYHLLKRKVATAIPVTKGIKQSEYVDSPFVLGIVRPVIYLPFGMAEADMAYVIAHEKAHIRRADHWWKPLGFGLLSVYWFNPVLWVAYILLCRDIEAACDEKVIRGMDRDARRAYSTALLNCSIHRRRIAACPLAFGETGVKARVKGVMNYKKPAFWLILLALVLVALVSVCFLTDPSSKLPITMYADFVSRTRADLKFQFEKPLPEDGYHIAEAYHLEARVNGLWQELPTLTEEPPSTAVTEVTAKDADCDAWSLLNWEDVYGQLPDGTYRIVKEVTLHGDSGEAESHPLSVEFTIGGAADKYVTYTLEDITPTGAKLYEQETGENIICDGDAGIWLEALKDGQWAYVAPTQYMEPILKQEKHFIHQRIYPSEYIQLDWSSLYGELPDGFYRLAREVTHIGEADLRVCTAYVEFIIGNVYIWFDRYAESFDQQHPKDTVIDLPGLAEASVSYDHANNEIRLITAADIEPILSSNFQIQNAFLTDLNGDGVSEICVSLQTEESMSVQVYDAVARKRYTLPVEDDGYYVLRQKADRLCALKYDNSFAVTEYAQVSLTSHGLELREIDDALKALTESVTCVDIWTRKQVSLFSGEHFHRVLTLLGDLKNQVTPATGGELAAVQEDTYNLSTIVVTYALGERTIVFSENFAYVWESGSEAGYRVGNPEPLRQFVEAVTNGVRNQQVTGQPFASVDAPWEWCAGIQTSAVESAQAHVCLDTYSYANTSGSSSTNGWISYDTLERLLQVLNRLPKSAFTPDRMSSQESYRDFFINQQAENGSISLIDGVNNIAAVVNYKDGKVTMLLTDDMEKVRENSHTYLEPTQVWAVEDPTLAKFMYAITRNPPVIHYSVGAEYDWQAPIAFEKDAFALQLRLPEGWEYGYVTNPTDSGIRCRPEGIADGWLYFSYWPGEYQPVEADRYIAEGSYRDWTTYTSYAEKDVRIPGGISTSGQVWSYERYDLEEGDYVVINDGADAWFSEYGDCIQDIMILSNITVP